MTSSWLTEHLATHSFHLPPKNLSKLLETPPSVFLVGERHRDHTEYLKEWDPIKNARLIIPHYNKDRGDRIAIENSAIFSTSPQEWFQTKPIIEKVDIELSYWDDAKFSKKKEKLNLCYGQLEESFKKLEKHAEEIEQERQLKQLKGLRTWTQRNLNSIQQLLFQKNESWQTTAQDIEAILSDQSHVRIKKYSSKEEKLKKLFKFWDKKLKKVECKYYSLIEKNWQPRAETMLKAVCIAKDENPHRRIFILAGRDHITANKESQSDMQKQACEWLHRELQSLDINYIIAIPHKTKDALPGTTEDGFVIL
jgi:hypothetical protein